MEQYSKKFLILIYIYLPIDLKKHICSINKQMTYILNNQCPAKLSGIDCFNILFRQYYPMISSTAIEQQITSSFIYSQITACNFQIIVTFQ